MKHQLVPKHFTASGRTALRSTTLTWAFKLQSLCQNIMQAHWMVQQAIHKYKSTTSQLKNKVKNNFVCIAMWSLVMLWNSYNFEWDSKIVLFVFIIVSLAYTWQNICNAWFLDIRISTCFILKVFLHEISSLL